MAPKATSPVRAGQFLKHLKCLTTRFELMATPGVMGEGVARLAHLPFTVVGIHVPTSATDTVSIAETLNEAKEDLLVFCGGRPNC